jgi:hydrogenase maturation protease
MAVRIIGCGTWDRGDDAAGLLVARLLRERGIDAIEHTGDGLALIDAWQEAGEVVLIDAVITGGVPGTVTEWNAGAPVMSGPGHNSSHAFGVADAIRLARALGKLPARFRMCGIEARQFGLGTPPAPEVAAAVQRLAESLSAQFQGHS